MPSVEQTDVKSGISACSAEEALVLKYQADGRQGPGSELSPAVLMLPIQTTSLCQQRVSNQNQRPNATQS